MISGHFDPARPPHAYIDVAVFIEGITPNWTLVEFMVDTGATRTCIHPLDSVRRIGVSPADLTRPELWPRHVPGTGVGGGALYYECRASYGFHTDDDRWIVVAGTVLVAELTAANQSLPSLLGWDLLQHFRLTASAMEATVVLEQV